MNQVMLTPELFHLRAMGAQLIPTLADGFIERVKRCVERDEKVVKVLKELGTSTNLRGGEWKEEDGLVLFHGKVYIPLDPQLRHDIVQAHHDSYSARHPGRWQTTELV